MATDERPCMRQLERYGQGATRLTSIYKGPLTLEFDRATWPFLKFDRRH